MGTTTNVDKARSTGFDINSLLGLTKAVNGSTTNGSTSRSPNIQANLDQLIATLTGAQGGYTKDAAIKDNTGAAYRVEQLLQQAMPQISSGQLQSGLYSPTTSALLQNNLASQITNSELNAQQQQIKDYATIQANQAQAAASAANASGQTQTQVTPGVGIGGLVLPTALSYGVQKGMDYLLGSSVAPAAASQVAGSVAGTAAANTGASYLGNLVAAPSATTYAGANALMSPTVGATPSLYGESIFGGMGTANAPVVGGNAATYVGSGNEAVAQYLTTNAANSAGISYSAPDAAAWFADDAAMMAGSSGAAGTGSWMSTAGSYASAAMPYIAAAMVVDQLTGGKISQGITQASDWIGTREPLDDLADSAGDFIRDPIGKAGDFLSNTANNYRKHDPVTATFRSIGSIICTALHDTGYMTSYEHRAATVYTARHVPSHVYEYYLGWATPIASDIRTKLKSDWSLKTKLAAKLLTAYAKHAAGKASWFESKAAKAFIAYNTYQADKLQAQYAGV